MSTDLSSIPLAVYLEWSPTHLTAITQ